MRQRHGVIFLLVVLIGIALQVFSTGGHRVAAGGQSVPQTLWGTYWTAQPGFISTLEMKNNLSAAPLDVNVSLYFTTGEEYPLNPIHLVPRQTTVIDLNAAIATLSGPLAARATNEGTVEVAFSAPTAAALMGSISVLNPKRGTAWNFFLYARRPDEVSVPVHGLFWFKDKETEGFIATQNISEDSLVLTPRLEIGIEKLCPSSDFAGARPGLEARPAQRARTDWA